MSNKIKAIREAKGMRQSELADKAGVSRPYMYDLENGARGAKPDTLSRIAEVLGVTVDELIGEEVKTA